QQVSILYQSWFEDFKRTDGICPEDWNYQELSTIADIASGKRPPVKSEVCNQETPVAIVGAASVMGFTSEANHIDKILVTGRVGTHGIIQRFNTPCWASDNTLVITSPYYEFTNQILHRIDYSSMNRGSTQPLITQGDIKKVVVLVPDEETLAKFEEFASSLMAKWEANKIENVKLALLRDALLPKLMSGELDVSDIDL
ncbi:restriction endonuclease subunit S, partial [Fusobacterium necrophorum]